MKIGIELSGTLLDVLSAAVDYFGEPQQKEASTFEEMYPMISDSNLSVWLSSERTYATMPAMDGALRAIDILSQKHSICGITSIGKHLMNTVASWLINHGVPITDVSHTQNKDIRARISKVDIFIESDAASARRISKECRVILLDNPYNRFGAGANTERAHSWDEILELINHGQNA